MPLNEVAAATLPAGPALAPVAAALARLLEGRRGVDAVDAALTLVLDALGDGVALVAPDGGVLLANRAMERFGVRAGEALAGDLAASLGPLLGVEPGELGLVAGERALWVAAAPLDPGGGGLGGHLLVARDASEARARELHVRRLEVELAESAAREQALAAELAAEQRAEEEAQRLRAQAEAASRAKSAYLANMSHELRTPLNSILGFAQLLERDRGLSEQHRENLLVIGKAGEHLLGLINDILEMAKIEAGQVSLNESDFDLHHMLGGIEEMFAMQARKKGLALLLERDPALPRYVRADEGKLRQVLINLLGNAIKFTSRGAVTLRAMPAARGADPGVGGRTRLVFEVADTGRGIAPAEIGALFRAFSQAHGGKEISEGTGLGLAISRQFVELMGGEIRAASAPGQGSTFTFDVRAGLSSLPVVRALLEPRVVLGLAPGQPSYRVLVVDDGWQSRHLLIKRLTGLGFQVRGATNGLGAIAQFESWEPHVIFMDMRMPLLDGYEATRRIKATERGRSTAIVGMTASAFEHNRTQVLAVGCDEFLRKPYRDHEICDRLKQLLGVDFEYEDARPSLPAAPPLSGADLGAAAAALPEDWRAELCEAATRGDSRAAFLVVDMIRVQSQELAEALAELVRGYRFDRVLALLSGDAPPLLQPRPAAPAGREGAA